MRVLTLTFVAVVIAAIASRSAAAEPVVLENVVLRPMVEAEVPARQTGVLSRIEVAEGAVVAEGDVVASLDDRAARLALDKASVERDQAAAKAANELRVKYADKALEVARAELKRSSESIKEFAKSISQSQIDVERLTVEKLELERQQAELDITLEEFELRLKDNALETAMLDVELHTVRAPFAGVVALVRGRAGEWVEPGAAVLRLVAIDALRAEGFVAADAIEGVKTGAAVQFAPNASPGADAKPLAGVLRFVSPEIDPVTKQVRIWAEIDNRDHRVRPGQQGTLRIE
jgi:macrolide-specific efflux system membrane fusion protein